MYLKRFQAKNYRNIAYCDLTFERGVNLLIGENAQGKTNALEGIYAFARGKSFRGASDAELTRFDTEGFETEITYEDRQREQTLSYSYIDGKRTRLRNGVKMTKVSDTLGHFRAVLFYPEHLQIIKGGPSERRELINIAISQLDSQYVRDYTAYQKILDNRNYLLKNALKGIYFDREELYAWSEQLAEYAARIHTTRAAYIRGLVPHVAAFMKDISSDKESLTISYVSDTEEEGYEEAKRAYLSVFTENTDRECAAGCTLWGVHRDDMEFILDGRLARTYASQGQQRSCVLAVKLAEGEYARERTGDYPVYLFDDVLSELDSGRRGYVLGMSDERQLILTACDSHLEGEGYHEIRVEGGIYVSSHR